MTRLCSVCRCAGHNKRTCRASLLEGGLRVMLPDEDPLPEDIPLTPTPRDEVDIETDGWKGILLVDDILEIVGVEVGKVRERLTLEYWMDGTHRFRKGIRASVPRNNKDLACGFIRDKIGRCRRPHESGTIVRSFIPMNIVVRWGSLCPPYYYKPSPTTKQRTKSQKRVSHCSACGCAGHTKSHNLCPLHSDNLYFQNGRWRHRDIANGLIPCKIHRHAHNFTEYVNKCYHDLELYEAK